MKLNRKIVLIAVAYIVFFIAACTNNNAITSTSSTSNIDAVNSILLNKDSLQSWPFTEQRLAAIEATMALPTPILLLADSISASQKLAQEIAIKDSSFTKYCKEEKSKTSFRNEIFNVFPARQSDMVAVKQPYQLQNIYRVEMYNYGLNMTTMSLVDVQQNKTLYTNYYAQTQPDIPSHLKTLALKIAVNSPAVQNALGYTPKETEALMANTQTALNRTKCERSRHLCVAPTFVKGDKALWAIVDLTEQKLVGVRWTNVGTTGTADKTITERRLQDDKITACFCEKETPLTKNGWQLNYMLTSSDGLRVSDVTFNGTKILTSAKLVDWHVSYSGTDGFGYSDAVGCPNFSQSAVVAIEAPKVLQLTDGTGFVLEQSYASQGWPTACNYNYKQRFEFYNDGSFRVSCASLGRGCGNNGTYRPVFRIAFADNSNNFYEYQNAKWSQWAKENWALQKETTTYNAEGGMFKISNASNKGFYLAPGNGKFNDGGRGDNAYIYATLNLPNRDEGDADLPTIGPCCNIDYKQGPEKFIEPNAEGIVGKQIVVWYVAQLKNDDTKGREYCWAESVLKKGIYTTEIYPCFCGPKFIPIK
jgi:hypothetical protein